MIFSWSLWQFYHWFLYWKDSNWLRFSPLDIVPITASLSLTVLILVHSNRVRRHWVNLRLRAALAGMRDTVKLRKHSTLNHTEMSRVVTRLRRQVCYKFRSKTRCGVPRLPASGHDDLQTLWSGALQVSLRLSSAYILTYLAWKLAHFQRCNSGCIS